MRAWHIGIVGLLFGCTDPLPPRAAQPLVAPPVTTTPPLAPPDPGVRDGHPGVVLATPHGTLSVDEEGRLALGTQRLDTEVVAELALSPDGHTLAYPRRTPTGSTLVLRALSEGTTRTLGASLHLIDRPVFHPRGHAVFAWGNDGVLPFVGLYRLGLDGTVQRLNNDVTRIDDPRFVEPPIEHPAHFTADDTLVYRGPNGNVAVHLPPEAQR